jgi:hypothetical protein
MQLITSEYVKFIEQEEGSAFFVRSGSDERASGHTGRLAPKSG